MPCCHPLQPGSFLPSHCGRGSHGEVAIPSRARPDDPDPEPGLTPHHGSLLSAFLGQAWSGLTACQDTTDALTGLPLRVCRLGLSPGTQHGTARGIPTPGISTCWPAGPQAAGPTQHRVICVCAKASGLCPERGARDWLPGYCRASPDIPWGKTLGALQHTGTTWHPCWTSCWCDWGVHVASLVAVEAHLHQDALTCNIRNICTLMGTQVLESKP